MMRRSRRDRGSSSLACAAAIALAAVIVVAGGPSAGAQSGGTKLWERLYRGQTPSSQDEATDIAVSPDGATVYVTGESGYAPQAAFVTVAYNASTKAKLWVSRYEGPTGFSAATALGISPDGSTVFVTGYSYGPTSGQDYATVAYASSTGAQLWASRYNGMTNGDDQAAALGVSPNGSTLFVTGLSIGSSLGSGRNAHPDIATVAYQASTGETLWVKRSPYGAATALGVSPDSSTVFVTGGGSAGGNDGRAYTTVAYRAATGEQLWLRRYNAPGTDNATALGVSPDGSTVFVTGDSTSSTSEDYATVAYASSTGAQLWASRYNGSANYGDQAKALSVSPDGSTVFVSGSSGTPATLSDFATVAYSASTGATRWVSRYDDMEHEVDGATALGVSPDGSTVFVTGLSYGSTGYYDYVTVAYRALTGTRRWVRRYHGPARGDDYPNALAVSPEGSAVFVSGQIIGVTSAWDYATVAYAAR